MRPAADSCDDRGMARTRVSTAIDANLLGAARQVFRGRSDAAMLDAAVAALVARHRLAEIDAAYTAYDEVPLDAPDAWGDLRSFSEATAAS